MIQTADHRLRTSDQRAKESKTTLLLVEQNAKWALSVSSRGYTLENGAISLEGKGSDLAENDYVKKAYLGY